MKTFVAIVIILLMVVFVMLIMSCVPYLGYWLVLQVGLPSEIAITFGCVIFVWIIAIVFRSNQ
jgi:hypothetical protein